MGLAPPGLPPAGRDLDGPGWSLWWRMGCCFPAFALFTSSLRQRPLLVLVPESPCLPSPRTFFAVSSLWDRCRVACPRHHSHVLVAPLLPLPHPVVGSASLHLARLTVCSPQHLWWAERPQGCWAGVTSSSARLAWLQGARLARPAWWRWVSQQARAFLTAVAHFCCGGREAWHCSPSPRAGGCGVAWGRIYCPSPTKRCCN